MDRVSSESLNRLYKVILDLKTIEECYDFFEDLCTVPELKAISQRFKVAKLLLEMPLSELKRRTTFRGLNPLAERSVLVALQRRYKVLNS